MLPDVLLPGSADLELKHLLDLCLLPSSMVQYRHFHLTVVSGPLMRVFRTAFSKVS